MKYVTTALLCATLGAVPLAALAQTQPPPPGNPNGPTPEMRQQFEQMRTQMQSMHAQFRSQVLAALTPAHRALVQQIAGQLAVGEIPDYRTAAQRLDAALSAPEKQAVIAAADANRQQMRSFMQQQRARMESQMPAGQRPPMEQHEGDRNANAPRQGNRQPDAGTIVLRATVGGGPGFGGFDGLVGRRGDRDGDAATGTRG